MFLSSWRLFACSVAGLFACVVTGPAWSAPPSGATEADFVYLEGSLTPATQTDNYTPPDGQILVITDIVIQNMSPGGGPVLDEQYSVIFVSGDNSDMRLNAVGNHTVSLNFSTGVRVKGPFFRILNSPGSSAPFVSVTVTGYLTKRPAGF